MSLFSSVLGKFAIMNTRKSLGALFLVSALTLYSVALVAQEKSVKHITLPDLTSLEEAKQVFSETTSKLQTKKKLDAVELDDIHQITYSLEKALEYLVDNVEGEQQKVTQEMADLVELVHIASENNRASETARHLKEYFNIAESFSEEL